MPSLPLKRLKIFPVHSLVPMTPCILLTFALTSCSLPGMSSGASNDPTAVPTSSVASPAALSLVDKLAEQTVERVNPTVVKIENVGIGLGSGVIIRPDGYIVTNNHVVAGEHQIRVDLPNGTVLAGRLVGTDPTDDLAVVKVNVPNLPAATFGDSSTLAVGQTVLAVGNPLGTAQTVTEGIVSALNRTVSEGQGGGVIRRAVQTSAPINPGNSGGALVDLASQVIGIPTLTAVDPEFGVPASGIGFAISSNVVKNISAQLIQYGKVIHTGRAALGIGALSISPDLAAQYHLPVKQGVLISTVQKGQAAAKSGLKSGDIIIKLGTQPITSETDLLDVLGNKSPGDAISVTIVDAGGKQHVYKATLGEFHASNSG